MTSSLNFENNAQELFLYIIRIFEDNSYDSFIDLDIADDILCITMSYGVFTFIKNYTSKEIELISSVNGTYHFSHYDNNDNHNPLAMWISNNNEKLSDVTNTEFKLK